MGFLFPAHAGVIPEQFGSFDIPNSFPRTRGGDPPIIIPTALIYSFSPHTRG